VVRRKRLLGPGRGQDLIVGAPTTPSKARHKEWKSGIAILTAGLALAIAIRVAIILVGVEVADVQHAHDIADFFLSGQNPYSLPPFQSNYPPISLAIEAASLYLSQLTSVPFHIVFKLWSVAADVGVGLMIFGLLQRNGRSPRRAALWSCAFLLNPVSIIVTAAHGQLDPVTNCLSVLALALLVVSARRLHVWSAVALGLAIGIKPNPALLLPIFATARGLSSRQRVAYVVLAGLPPALALVPFLLNDAHGVIANVFGYPGEYDFGYAAVLRAAWLMKSGDAWLPGKVGDDLGQFSRVSFLAAYGAVLAVGAGRTSLARLVTTVYLSFLVLFTGLSAQYTVWIVPFAVIAGDWFVIPYSIATTLSLVGFYLLFWPDILFGKFNTLPPLQVAFIPLYLWLILGAWIVDAIWLLRAAGVSVSRAVADEIRALYRAVNQEHGLIDVGVARRSILLAISVVVLGFSLVPTVGLVQYMLRVLGSDES
jgi:hypothetical protein